MGEYCKWNRLGAEMQLTDMYGLTLPLMTNTGQKMGKSGECCLAGQGYV